MGKDVIIALDFSAKAEVIAFLGLFGGERPFVKVGMELFYAEGPKIIDEIKKRGHKVFLDLKLHDIPNTVKKAMRVISELEVDMVNIHASGTRAMMRSAVEGLENQSGKRPLLLAVTLLTSVSAASLKDELFSRSTPEEIVMAYAVSAKQEGLDGVVCSPLETKAIRNACGEGFLTVTPGIRFSPGENDDQVRFTTPLAAKNLGADYIVVGRPITSSADPVAAYNECKKQFI